MSLVNTLQEQRNKLMTDAGVILRSESPTAEQLTSADAMMADATSLETRIGKLKTIETHEESQRAFVPAERPGIETNKPDARTRSTEALRSFMQEGRIGSEYRDVLTTSSSGAAVIPQLFNNELVTALRDFAPMLSIVDNKVTDNNGAPLKMSFVNYTTTNLPVVTEGTAATELDPTFTTSLVNVDKLMGIVKISNEELSDSGFDLAGWLAEQWGNVYGYTLENYVTNGNSSHIASLLSTAGNGGTTAAAGSIAYSDIAALYGSLTAAYARNGIFQMSTSTRAYLMGLIATTGQPIFDANPQGDPFSTIFGKKVIINDSLPSVAAGATPILFGDFKNGYLLRTDGAPTIKRLDERYADTDEVGFLIRTRVGGVSKSAGISPYKMLTIHS